jgi:hypothetical protein
MKRPFVIENLFLLTGVTLVSSLWQIKPFLWKGSEGTSPPTSRGFIERIGAVSICNSRYCIPPGGWAAKGIAFVRVVCCSSPWAGLLARLVRKKPPLADLRPPFPCSPVTRSRAYIILLF